MKNKMTTYQMTMTALFAALMCILGPMSIPIGQVPISFTNLVIYLAVFLLGTKYGTLAFAVYYLLGLVGLPVFSAYSGGLGKALGPTGGYLIGFFFMAIISGIAVKRFPKNYVVIALAMILGTAVAYLFGTLWFSFEMQFEFAYSLTICVYPFIVADLAKIVIALLVGTPIKARLIKAGLLADGNKSTEDNQAAEDNQTAEA